MLKIVLLDPHDAVQLNLKEHWHGATVIKFINLKGIIGCYTLHKLK